MCPNFIWGWGFHINYLQRSKRQTFLMMYAKSESCSSKSMLQISQILIKCRVMYIKEAYTAKLFLLIHVHMNDWCRLFPAVMNIQGITWYHGYDEDDEKYTLRKLIIFRCKTNRIIYTYRILFILGQEPASSLLTKLFNILVVWCKKEWDCF